MSLPMSQRKKYLQEHWKPGADNYCFYCGQKIPRKFRSIDHLMPISRGGTHDEDNLVLCCRQCNNAKSDMMLAEFVEFVASHGGIVDVKQRYGNGSQSRYRDFVLE